MPKGKAVVKVEEEKPEKLEKLEKTEKTEKSMRIGRPLKSSRQISVTSNKTIDRALELMVLQGLSKSKEKAATMLLSSAASKFVTNNLKMVSSLSLEELLDTADEYLEMEGDEEEGDE
jgi:hypothetical protein